MQSFSLFIKQFYDGHDEPSSFLILDSLSIMTSGGNAPLRVAVVGAGLGGLAVSAALRQQGHVVEVCFVYSVRFPL